MEIKLVESIVNMLERRLENKTSIFKKIWLNIANLNLVQYIRLCIIKYWGKGPFKINNVVKKMCVKSRKDNQFFKKM